MPASSSLRTRSLIVPAPAIVGHVDAAPLEVVMELGGVVFAQIELLRQSRQIGQVHAPLFLAALHQSLYAGICDLRLCAHGLRSSGGYLRLGAFRRIIRYLGPLGRRLRHIWRIRLRHGLLGDIWCTWYFHTRRVPRQGAHKPAPQGPYNPNFFGRGGRVDEGTRLLSE